MKYPRTFHLPWSPGGTKDDRRLSSTKHLLDTNLVLTEKMDGSNVCLESGNVFARSHSSAPSHPSFDALKAYWAERSSLIPEGFQIFGEWCYAKHSISYDKLPDFLMVFAIRELASNTWLSWSDVVDYANLLDLKVVPVLQKTRVGSDKALEELTNDLATKPSLCGGDREGIVVRRANGFDNAHFSTCVAKWVRKHHVQTDDHWKHQAITRNTKAAPT